MDTLQKQILDIIQNARKEAERVYFWSEQLETYYYALLEIEELVTKEQ